VATLAAIVGLRQSQKPPSAPPPVAPAHSPESTPSPVEARELEGLRARLAAAPDDLVARKRLAVRLIETGQFVEAFGEAKEVLKRDPNDIDGLYVQGVVRLAMGMWPQAQELLDRVLVAMPEHVPALIAKGRWYRGTGQVPLAIATWEKALKLAGGAAASSSSRSVREIQQLLSEVREGGTKP
jgi:tetratricopeptide (TPR) repeat protein